MKVAVLRETRSGEKRVALVSQGVKTLRKAGLEVTIETGAGASSGVSDDEYREAGATVASSAADAVQGAGVVLRVNPPSLSDPDELSGIEEPEEPVGAGAAAPADGGNGGGGEEDE